MKKIGNNIIMALICTALIIITVGCANSKEVADEGETRSIIWNSETASTKHNMREEETTTRDHVQGPTASVEPNDDVIEITTEKPNKPTTTKPQATTKPQQTEETTTTGEQVTDESETTSVDDEGVTGEEETTVDPEEGTDENESESGVENETTGSEEGTDEPNEDKDPFYMTKVQFDVYEMTYTTITTYIQNNPGNIEWISADDTVAQVIGGELVAIGAGETIITGTSGETSVEISINVAGDDYSGEEGETSARSFLFSDRLYLFTNSSVALPEKVMEKLELLLDEIEAVTGYSYTDISENVEYSSSRKKLIIKLLDLDYGDVYASTEEVQININNVDLSQYGANILAHELIHVIQYRNSVEVGNALTEGYAEYLQDKVCSQLEYETGYDVLREQLSQIGAIDDITEENIENKLMYTEDTSALSYLFVRYITTEYGEEKLKNLVDAITLEAVEIYEDVMAGESSLFSQEEIMTIIKKNTSEDVISKFYEYYNMMMQEQQ